MPQGSNQPSRLKIDLALTRASPALDRDNVGQTFVCEFVLRGRTLNAAQLKTVAGEPVSVDNWEPRIRILNMLESSIWSMHASDCADGQLEFKWRICGTFGERMELESFPLDCQKLQLDISSAIPAHKKGDPKAKILTFCNWADPAQCSAAVQRRNFTQSNVFELGAAVTMKPTLSDVSESTSNTVRPVLRIARRRVSARARGGVRDRRRRADDDADEEERGGRGWEKINQKAKARAPRAEATDGV